MLIGAHSTAPLLDQPLGSGGKPALRVAMVHLSDFRYDSRIQRQARALAERGDTVDLICLGEREELRVGDGSIRTHPIRCEKACNGMRTYLGSYAQFLFKAMRTLTLLDLKRRFDVVEVHNMPDILTLAACVPKLRGAAVILNVHDTFPELFATKFDRGDSDPVIRLLVLEERFSAALADCVITVTDEARLRLQSRGVGTHRALVVMNSPDQRVFGPPRPPVTPPAEGPVRLLYHGGTASRFGVDTVIEAIGMLSHEPLDLVLRICAAGRDDQRLRELAGRVAPERIEIIDEVPFEEIPSQLAMAHIGVVPTLRDSFTELLLPVKLLEDVHMGLPVITSRLSGISSYFADDEVWFAPPGDSGELARAIEQVCRHPNEAAERARRASTRLESIAWERQRVSYLQLVDELASGTRPLRKQRWPGRDNDGRSARLSNWEFATHE